MSDSIKQKIIQYIKKNRVSTTEVADALGKQGVLPDVFPINSQQHVVGEIHCVFAANNSNASVHEQVRDVNEQQVVVIFTENCEQRAVIGSLVAKYILLYQGANAVIVDGQVRDVSALKRENYRIWCKGFTPIGCYNSPAPAFNAEQQATLENDYAGAIAVADDTGVILIPNSAITEQLYQRLEHIELQEDIWFFCLDNLKWDTHKIVCDKAYFDETRLLSEVHKQQLQALKDFMED